MYHIAICDDEEKFVNEVEDLINKYATEKNVDICVSTYFDGANLIEKYPINIDLIFLDIKMKQVNGLKAAKEIRQIDSNVSIIFLTSLAQYALEGYKYNATNFLIKPIKYVRLKDELDRWMTKYQKNEEFIFISNDTGKYKIFLNSLIYVDTFGRNLMVHTRSENIVSYKKMKDFEIELSESSFVRCHTSYIINLFYVKRVKRLEIELTNREIIPISQLKRKTVMEKLAQYWGAQL